MISDEDDIDGAIKELIHTPEVAPVYCNEKSEQSEDEDF